LENIPRRIRLMFALTAVLIAGGIALTWLLNPFGATRSRFIDPIFRKIKRERLATPYLLRVAQPETVLLGSSRVLMGMRIEQGERDGVMNAAIKGATLTQISRIVDVALENPRLKRIVWGVDFFAFSTHWKFEDPSFDARIADNPQARLEDTLLSLDALGDGFDLFKRSLRGRARLTTTMKANVPWPMELICDQYVTDRADGLDVGRPAQIAIQMRQIMYLYRRYEFSQSQLEIFRETVKRIRTRDVALLLFVPPMSEYELELIRQSGHWGDLEKFKRALAAVAPFYDFAAYNGMAPRDEFYLQVIHFKAAPGHQIMRLLLGTDTATCNDDARIVAQSALRIDAASIDRVLATEAQMRDRAITQDSRYSRMAAEAVRFSKSEMAAGNSGDSGGGDE
jgi:hypothetical protein